MLSSIYWEIAGVSGLKPDWGVVPVLPTTALRKGDLERGEGSIHAVCRLGMPVSVPRSPPRVVAFRITVRPWCDLDE
jgi:hypothetical protein